MGGGEGGKGHRRGMPGMSESPVAAPGRPGAEEGGGGTGFFFWSSSNAVVVVCVCDCVLVQQSYFLLVEAGAPPKGSPRVECYVRG